MSRLGDLLSSGPFNESGSNGPLRVGHIVAARGQTASGKTAPESRPHFVVWANKDSNKNATATLAPGREDHGGNLKSTEFRVADSKDMADAGLRKPHIFDLGRAKTLPWTDKHADVSNGGPIRGQANERTFQRALRAYREAQNRDMTTASRGPDSPKPRLARTTGAAHANVSARRDVAPSDADNGLNPYGLNIEGASKAAGNAQDTSGDRAKPRNRTAKRRDEIIE